MSGKKGGSALRQRAGQRRRLRRWASVGLGLLALPCPAEPTVADVLFGNGDQLSGLANLGYEDGRLVMGGNNVIANGAKVPIKRLYKLRLSGAPLPAIDAAHTAQLELGNGDLIMGQLDRLTKDHVEMTVPGGNSQRFNRLMCRSLNIQRSEPAIYLGPGAMADWTRTEGADAWSLREQTLVSKGEGGIARKIEFPDQCRLSFDLSWDNQLKARILLFADEDGSKTPENCYDLVFQRRFVYLRKRWKTPQGAGVSNVGRPTSIRVLETKATVRMELFLDRKDGIITLYIDDRKAHVWSDEKADTLLSGNWLHFISAGSALRVSKIAVYPWHGTLPEAPNALTNDGPGDVEAASPLRGSEVVIHEVAATDSGDLVVKTPDAEVPVPKDRGLTIDLTSPDSEQPKRMKNDVRGWFHNEGFITFELRDITPESISGFSQAFGEATYSLAAFKHIEFNLYTEDLDARRAGLQWDEED